MGGRPQPRVDARRGWCGEDLAEHTTLAGQGLDNAERVLDTVVSESGKTLEDAQLADLGYTTSALGFWAKEAPRYLADEHVSSAGEDGV